MTLKNYSLFMALDTIHIEGIYAELSWLEKVIHQSIASYLMHEGHENNWYDIPLPELEEGAYTEFVIEQELNVFERLALALVMAPHVRPELLDIFFGKNQIYDRPFSEFGGVTDNGFSGLIPTAQTLSFLIAGAHQELKADFMAVLHKGNYLMKEQVLVLSSVEPHVPEISGILSMNQRWVHYFQTGEELPIEQSSSFPAHLITTKLGWDDVVLDGVVMEQVEEINTWLRHGQRIMKEWNLERTIKPGYRALFYGAPGTGKTLTATLLGKVTNRDVYRVDLSMIVSKYIGETEKNLAKIFDIAQYKDWILFFDEADSLFGKRTAATSSNDRHANQQTGYLLQRIEDFPGVIILASNLRDNMDAAFSRRFQSMIHFKIPTVHERYQLWQNAFAGTCKLDPSIDVYELAENYELAGGSIINVLRHCALAVVKRNDTVVQKQELLAGLRKEFKKENKTLTTNFK